jgi:predicted GIY-YIG superfamily endonuclease
MDLLPREETSIVQGVGLHESGMCDQEENPYRLDGRRVLVGTVYLIHAERKLAHSQHYIGFCTRGLETRIAYHRRGDGNPMLRAMNEAGIPWNVVRVWRGVDRNFERKIKNYRNATKLLCPVCRQEGRKILNRHARIIGVLMDAEKKGAITSFAYKKGERKQWTIRNMGEWKFTTPQVEAYLIGLGTGLGFNETVSPPDGWEELSHGS